MITALFAVESDFPFKSVTPDLRAQRKCRAVSIQLLLIGTYISHLHAVFSDTPVRSLPVPYIVVSRCFMACIITGDYWSFMLRCRRVEP